MHTIKFSHRYTKMPYEDRAILLEVFKVNYKDLSKVFLAYDTEILTTLEHYPLPKTDLLVLLLCSKEQGCWTTIRRWLPRKEEYYRGIRGEEVKIEIITDKNI